MIRAHLLDTQEPVKEGSNLLANCLTPVPNARFVFLWDNEHYPEFLSVSMSRICRECAKSELRGRYVYGIVNGQQTMDRNDEEWEAVA
jgi:hypothetical protein